MTDPEMIRHMKHAPLLVSGLAVLFLVTGCTSLKRYRSATFAGEDNSLVEMDLFGYQLIPSGVSPEGKNLWELSANAQTRLVQILDERYPDNTRFIRALNQEYLTPESVPSYDFTRKDLRMVFTISKKRDYSVLKGGTLSGHFSPADRIEYLSFSLKIPENYSLHFTEWNRFVTEYGEIEIGDISFARNLDLEMESAFSDQVDMGGTGSLGRTEDQQIRSRYLKLNGSISDNTIEIVEEGTREIDLTGNVTVDVSVEFSPFPERIAVPLFSPEQRTGTDTTDVAALRFLDVLVPRMEEIPDTIYGTLELHYVYRHVRSGWKTFQEWDDHVEYYTGSIRKKIPLFHRQDYVPSFYCIGTEGQDRKIVRAGPARTYPLQFRSYSDASRFFDWLRGHSDSREVPGDKITIGQDTLVFDGIPLTREQVSYETGLKVMPVYE